MLQRFFSGFLSVFRFGSVPFKKPMNNNCTEDYIDSVEQDFYHSYEKLKRHYEGK